MTGLSKRARKTMTAVVAVGALSGGVMLVPQLAVAVLSTARATTTLNVRLSPSTSAQVRETAEAASPMRSPPGWAANHAASASRIDGALAMGSMEPTLAVLSRGSRR